MKRMKNTTLFEQTLEKFQSQYGYGKASVTEFVPGFGFRNNFKIYPDGVHFQMNGVAFCDVDENFPDVYGIHIINGRFFSKNYSTDFRCNSYKRIGMEENWMESLEGKSVGLFTKDNRRKLLVLLMILMSDHCNSRFSQ